MAFDDNRIEHFVALMLENRSFDHMLGFSGIAGIDGLTGAETKQARLGTAPPMQGFIQSYFQVCNDRNRAKDMMRCFSPQTLPNLTHLAKNYAVCDRWFSSVPGPTLPNRSFAHAATSLGAAVGPPFLGNLHTIYAVLN
jgi:phospholipase C